MELGPKLPPAGFVDLPGRGRTWVYDSRAGDEPAVVLLHGWTSTAALTWYRTFPALAERGRVVALDHRGHGRGVRSRLPFQLEACAEDVAELIRVLDLEAPTVVGYSMGGPVAQLLARRHPELVGGLVLCATAARFRNRSQGTALRGAVGLGTSLAISFLPGSVRQRGMDAATRRWQANNSAAAWAVAEWRRHDPAALIQAGLALSRFDSTGWVSSIDAPTAVVVSTGDTTVSPHSQLSLAESIPGATVHRVAGEHRVCVDVPDLFVPALLEACDSVESRARAA